MSGDINVLEKNNEKKLVKKKVNSNGEKKLVKKKVNTNGSTNSTNGKKLVRKKVNTNGSTNSTNEKKLVKKKVNINGSTNSTNGKKLVKKKVNINGSTNLTNGKKLVKKKTNTSNSTNEKKLVKKKVNSDGSLKKGKSSKEKSNSKENKSSMIQLVKKKLILLYSDMNGNTSSSGPSSIFNKTNKKMLSPTKINEFLGEGPNNLLKTKAIDPTDAVMGVDREGKTYHVNLSSGPHWLVAGTTGSGKSVFLNSMFVSMMYHATPDELAFLLIDPKKVEFTPYVGLPHVIVDPVTEIGDVYGLLSYLAWEMDHRYSILENVGVKNINSYNEWALEHPNEAKEFGYFPVMKFIVCAIDEYAEIVLKEGNARDSEVLLSSIGAKARASGIVLIIATQRPSVEVFSSLLKANIPSRIGLRVADAANSNIIIQEDGLEKLLGKGDSIIKNGVDGSMIRVQGPFLTDGELEAIFDDLKAKYPPPQKLDYKQLTVDKGFTTWVEDYADDVPYEERHVKKLKVRGGGLPSH